ncbi:MAG TPA: hypothetical protein VFQ88_12030 [Nevskiaceae bacterium]|nr:hypothetical protein [Nevskiaceae bacterium]
MDELMHIQPVPSVSIQSGNLADAQRCRDARFSVKNEGWGHGDFVEINKRGGGYVYGCSVPLDRRDVQIGRGVTCWIPEQAESGDAAWLATCVDRFMDYARPATPFDRGGDA